MAQCVIPVVLCLPGVYHAALGQAGIYAEPQEVWILDDDIGQCGENVAGGGFVANGAATEFDVEAVKAHAKLVDHARAEVVRLAQQDCLAECGNVDYIPGCTIVVRVEIISAIEKVTRAQ